jgi:hypothetical protein
MNGAGWADSCNIAPMHISQKTNQELVVADTSIWVSIFLLSVTLFVLYRMIVSHARPGNYLVAGFFGLFVLLFWRKEVVVFDAGRQQVLWTRRRLFGVASGTVPFSEITGIGMETSSARNNVLVYRLAILTAQGSIPMSDNYAGDSEKYGKLRREILEFLKLDSDETRSALEPVLSSDIDEASVRSLLRQGRRIDAIRLVRSTQKLSLIEATDRVNAILREMNGAQ